jgi:predicted nucleic acid-binding protein
VSDILALSSVSFEKNPELFFDTNIWLYIYGPFANPNDWRTSKYSQFYKRVLENKCRIFINLTVISEFLNRYLRMIHDVLKKGGEAPENYKDFRATAAFVEALQGAADDLHHIMRDCDRVNTDISSIDFDNFIRRMHSGKMDFADIVAADHCVEKGWVLVTHDCDFSGISSKVATANPQLLKGTF